LLIVGAGYFTDRMSHRVPNDKWQSTGDKKHEKHDKSIVGAARG